MVRQYSIRADIEGQITITPKDGYLIHSIIVIVDENEHFGFARSGGQDGVPFYSFSKPEEPVNIWLYLTPENEFLGLSNWEDEIKFYPDSMGKKRENYRKIC